jgi:hypothetical protein
MCYIDGQKNKYSVLNECHRMLKYNILLIIVYWFVSCLYIFVWLIVYCSLIIKHCYACQTSASVSGTNSSLLSSSSACMKPSCHIEDDISTLPEADDDVCRQFFSQLCSSTCNAHINFTRTLISFCTSRTNLLQTWTCSPFQFHQQQQLLSWVRATTDGVQVGRWMYWS